MHKIDFHLIEFNSLSVRQLHDILQLRSDVFIVEQNCAYNDLDGMDPVAIHALIIQADQLCGTARILPPGTLYDLPSIGRVCTHKDHRSKQFGRLLMERTIEFCELHYKALEIKITAQQYLEKFYGSLGFQTRSEPYLWDGIWHVDMYRPANFLST